MKKFLLKVIGKLLVVAAIAMVSIVVYTDIKKLEVFQAVTTTEDLEGTIYTSEMAFDEARKIGKVFGYESMYSYIYNLDQSPGFVKKTEEDGWLKGSMKDFGHFFLGKEYNIELRNYFMLGYDFSKLKKEDVTYLEESKTLLIKLPPLELTYTPDYDSTEFSSYVGLFRKWFTDEEKHQMYNDSIKIGIEKLIHEEKEEIQKGHDFTQKMITKILLDLPGIFEHVENIEFIQSSNDIVISIDEYKEKNNEKEKENTQ